MDNNQRTRLGLISLLALLPVTEILAAPSNSVVLNNGKLVPAGTSIWIKKLTGSDSFSWNGDSATHVEPTRKPSLLTVTIQGDSGSNKFVFIANPKSLPGTPHDILQVSLEQNAKVYASLYGERDLLDSTNVSAVELTGAEDAQILISDIIGGESSADDSSKLESHKNVVTINGPFSIQSGADKAQIVGGTGFFTSDNGINITGTTIDLQTNASDSEIVAGLSVSDSLNSWSTQNVISIKNSPLVSAKFIAAGISGGNTSGNKVLIDVSTVQSTTLASAWSGEGDSSGNSLTVKDSKIKSDVIYGGFSENGQSNNNTVEIESSAIEGTVYAGYSLNGSSNNNSITVRDIATKSDLSKTSLVGGSGSNNSLTIEGFSGNVQSLKGFNEISFDTINWQPKETLVQVTGEMQDLAAVDIKLKAKEEDGRSTFDINSEGGNINGYMFLLKPSTSQESQNYDIVQRGWVQNSTLTEKRAALIKSGKSAFLLIEPDAPDVPNKPDEPVTPDTGSNPAYPPDTTIDPPSLPEIFPNSPIKPKPNKQVEVINDSREASLSFVNAGSNHLLNVLDSLLTEPYEGVKPFASVYGQVSKYRGHGDLEIKGFEFIAGIGQRIKLTDGFLKVGLFAESGIGTYSTHNSYRSKSIKGKGRTNYEGGGAFVQYKADNGLFVLGGLRGGRLKNKLQDGILHTNGTTTSYATLSGYLNTIVGVGYDYPINDVSSLILEAKYLYGRYGKDTVKVGNNKVRFGSVNSHRAQLEIGYKRNLTKKTMVWGALIGEREFSGNTYNAVDFISVHGKGLKGNTVRGDLAVKYMSDSKVSADFKVSGSLGKMQGVAARIQIGYVW